MDSSQITHLSLCAGYGGIDLGLHRAVPNLRTVAACEIEAFAVANLVAKMEAGLLDPAPVWTDLKTFPWAEFRGRIHLLSGGYQCQPFSSAGKRLGFDDPRHLWPFILDGIRVAQPDLCFFENVEGHISLGLESVLADLEAAGYRATWGIFSAVEVGLPHRRKRVFICAARRGSDVAHRIGTRLERFSGHVDGAGRECDGPGGPAAAGGVSRRGEAQFEWEMPRVAIPTLDRAVDGSSGRLVPAIVDSRIDELRLLGNGVVPATAHRAFTVLLTRLTSSTI